VARKLHPKVWEEQCDTPCFSCVWVVAVQADAQRVLHQVEAVHAALGPVAARHMVLLLPGI
jgi:hypothetical protein